MPLPKIGEEVVVYGNWGEATRKAGATHWIWTVGFPDGSEVIPYFFVEGFSRRFYSSDENAPEFGWRRTQAKVAPVMVPVSELEDLRHKLLLSTSKIVGDYDKKVAELEEEIEGLENSRNGWQRDAENYVKRIEELKGEKTSLESLIKVVGGERDGWLGSCIFQTEEARKYKTRVKELEEEIEVLRSSHEGWHKEVDRSYANAEYWRKKHDELFVEGTATQREISLENDVKNLEETVRELQEKLKGKEDRKIFFPKVGDFILFFPVDRNGKPEFWGRWSFAKEKVERVDEEGFWAFGRDKRLFKDVGVTWRW
jgi:hypothetical protein